ncbi:MAG TPA: serine/threonine-protein kinase, partial [Polyangiales bacterium]|nr:serine/threonine-protein kinase [Polyangiales bacterium]
MAAFPATMLIAAPWNPMVAAQLHDPEALTIFVTQNVISLGATLTGIISSHRMWRLRRETYEARNLGRYRELLAISRLSHPHTVRILDHGVTPEGIWFYAMELLRGEDLAALLKRDGPLPPVRAIDLMSQVCAALAEAHHHGVVHRDLKPGNLFVATVAGQAAFIKVLDFGLAKLTLEPEPEGTQLTHDGSLLGTPSYMAPETLADGKQVDPRSDVYALGCVLYEMLAGRPPFEDASLPGLLRQHAETRA